MVKHGHGAAKAPGKRTPASRQGPAASGARAPASAASSRGVMAPPPPRSGRAKRGSAIECLRFGSTPSEEVPWARYEDDGDLSTAAGSACKRCWLPFIRGYSHRLDWEKLCAAVEDSQEEMDKFELACSIVADGAEPPWFPSEVRQTESMKLHIKRSMIAIPRADYVDMVGKGPEDDRVGLVDCRDEHGTTFKGLLCRNPFRPWLEYEMIYEAGVEKYETKMPPNKQVTETQPDEQWRHCISEQQKGDDKFYQKLKGCNQTLQKVSDKIGVNILEKASHKYGWFGSGAVLSTAGASKHDSDDSDSDDGGRMVQAPTVSVQDGPSLARRRPQGGPPAKAARRSSPLAARSVVSAGSKSAGGTKLAPSVAGSRMDLMSKASVTPAAASPGNNFEAEVQRHLEAVNIGMFLNKEPGARHALRWAKSCLEKFEKDYKDDMNYNVLLDHVDDARVADRLGKTPLKKYESESQLDTDLAALADYGESFPTPLKYDILERSMETASDCKSTAAFMAMVCPWLHNEMREGGKPAHWSPVRPRLCMIEGSKADLSRYFRQKVVQLLCMMLKRGADSYKDCRATIERIVKFLDANQVADDEGMSGDDGPTGASDTIGEADDAYDDDINVILKACEALRLLFDFGSRDMCNSQLSASADLHSLLKAKDSKKREQSWYMCWVMMSRTIDADRGMNAQQAELFKAYTAPMTKHGPLLTDALKYMRGTTNLQDGVMPDTFENFLRLLVPALSELPEGACARFEDEGCVAVKTIIEQALIFFQGAGGEALGQTKMLALESAVTHVVELATDALLAERRFWEKASAALQAYKHSNAQSDLIARFAAVLKQAMSGGEEDARIAEDIFVELRAMADKVIQSVAVASTPLVQALAPEILKVVVRLLDQCDNIDGARPLHALSVDLLSLVPSGDLASGRLHAHVKQIEQADALSQTWRVFFGGGADSLPTIIGDTDRASLDGKLKECRIRMKLASEVMAGQASDDIHPLLKTEVGAAAKVWAQVQSLVVEVRSSRLNGIRHDLEEHCNRCSWPMPPTTAGASWAKFEKAATTFLNYEGAKELHDCMNKFSNSLDILCGTMDIFELPANDDIAHNINLRDKSNGLVWTAKTMKNFGRYRRAGGEDDSIREETAQSSQRRYEWQGHEVDGHHSLRIAEPLARFVVNVRCLGVCAGCGAATRSYSSGPCMGAPGLGPHGVKTIARSCIGREMCGGRVVKSRIGGS